MYNENLLHVLLSNLQQLAMLVSELALCLAVLLAPLPEVLKGLVQVLSG